MKKLLSIVMCSSLVVLLSNNANATGFALLEQSGKGVGDAFSGAVVGYGDGSEAFFNPAAQTQLNGTTFAWQVSLIDLKIDFKNMGSTDSSGQPLLGHSSDGGGVKPMPSVYLSHKLTDDLAVGFSFNVPYGFDIKYSKDWIGRYKAVESAIKYYSFTPSIAYEVLPHLSIGGGFGFSYVDAKISNAIDFGSLGQKFLGPDRAALMGLYPQSSDGFVTLSGDDWTTQFNIGALYTFGPNDRNKIGIDWRSRIRSDIGAHAYFDVPENAKFIQANDMFVNTSAGAHLTMPEVVTFGSQYWITDRWAIQEEIAWTRWSRFKELRIRYGSSQPDSVENENWTNSWRYSVGTQYKLTDNLTVRGGWTHDQGTIYDPYRSPRVPDQTRNWMAYGLDYQLTDNIDLYVSYAYLFVHGAASDIADSFGNRLIGRYNLGIQTVAFGMTASF